MSVSAIYQALAENAGRSQLARGALIGNAVSNAAQVPAQIVMDRERQRAIDLHTQQVQQQMALEAARGRRDDAAATRQAGLDTRAETAAMAADQKEKALRLLIGAGFEDDPSTFNIAKSVAKAKEIGAEDLLPTVAAVHEKFAPKVEAVEPDRDIIDKSSGALIRKGEVKPHAPTGPEMDQAAQQLYMKRKLGLKMTAEEDAALSAYEDRKRVVSDPASLAATERATAAQNAAAAQQSRAQGFQEAQAGRKELTDKVETPYQTALGSANTLRDVVSAAKAGNKVAGSLQSLEATMAAIRAQGLNRINMAEIGVTADAGNLWDHIVGYIGKKAEGQPVPENIQNDMERFADILEKAAYKKYIEGHQAITKRYGLKDETPLPAPGAATVPAGTGLSYADYIAAKKKKP